MKQRQNNQNRRSQQVNLFPPNEKRESWALLPEECQRELTSLLAQMLATLLADEHDFVDGQRVVSSQDGECHDGEN